ncbi:extensin family protein [Phenylobacterium sp.]|uniref:extensin-like domain-containing protein n=1 Tax=Phenylobacterium sp. TaxID=1871053 RepID=UPI0027184A34|nr:extensin family protein [Phenylobacterium sp.]MDO8377776.1 extensin family protein [Phenylobacterium sp.]
MAYRAPRHPHIEKHARRQTLMARIVGLVLIWGVVGIMALLAERTVPPEHLPWKPLSVIDPVGVATKAKAARTGEDPAACRAVLTQGGLSFREVQETSADGTCQVRGALRFTGGMAPLRPADVSLTCKEALAVSIWERQVVQPAAFEVLGEAVTAIDNYGSYACRRIYGQAEGPVSEHASANALDVAGFKLANGEVISVLKDWNDPGPKGRFLHRVRDGGCRVFVTVLSPDYNAQHANHFHLDMGGSPLCR